MFRGQRIWTWRKGLAERIGNAWMPIMGGLPVGLGKVPQSALYAGRVLLSAEAMSVWQVSGKTPGLPAFHATRSQCA